MDAELNLDNLNQEQLNAAENVPVCTDIGGIAGFSSGILQGCVNTGAVGYAHVGYNIGGVVGRQSGYLNGCTNSGTILGRKDVGGIAGQLVPEVQLLYNGGLAGDLLDELDVLRASLTRQGTMSAVPPMNSQRGCGLSPTARGRPRKLSVTWQISPPTGPMKTSMRSMICPPEFPGSSTS